MSPQQSMSESNELGLPVMSMHNAKMVTLTLNIMNVPHSSDVAVGHAATGEETDMLEDLVMRYYTMTESTALAASVTYFMNMRCSCVALCCSNTTHNMCEAFGSLQVCPKVLWVCCLVEKLTTPHILRRCDMSGSLNHLY